MSNKTRRKRNTEVTRGLLDEIGIDPGKIQDINGDGILVTEEDSVVLTFAVRDEDGKLVTEVDPETGEPHAKTRSEPVPVDPERLRRYEREVVR